MGTKVILWCDGLKKESASEGKKQVRIDSSDSEGDEEIQEVRR